MCSYRDKSLKRTKMALLCAAVKYIIETLYYSDVSTAPEQISWTPVERLANHAQCAVFTRL